VGLGLEPWDEFAAGEINDAIPLDDSLREIAPNDNYGLDPPNAASSLELRRSGAKPKAFMSDSPGHQGIASHSGLSRKFFDSIMNVPARLVAM
jgi:hypothetical protein